MTTNSEHRRRETDKVDQISLKYQLEKAEERIAEFESAMIKVKDCLYKNVKVIVANDYLLEEVLAAVVRLTPKLNQDE